MSKGDPKTLAGRIFDGFCAESEVGDRLDEFWPDLVGHISHDHYDQSLEVYFVKAAPEDLSLTKEQAQEIFQMGFCCGWLNFADGTEQSFSSYDGNKQEYGVFIRERKKVANPKWMGEKRRDERNRIDYVGNYWISCWDTIRQERREQMSEIDSRSSNAVFIYHTDPRAAWQDFKHWHGKASKEQQDKFDAILLKMVKQENEDFNAHIPGVPRAGCTAADRGQALWDIMTVLAGRRALGSVHADETRGGMEEIRKLWSVIEEVTSLTGRGAVSLDDLPTLDCAYFEHEDAAVGKRRDILVYDREWVEKIMANHRILLLKAAPIGASRYVESPCQFIKRSLTEIFPLGSPERNAIDEMYGEDSQSQ